MALALDASHRWVYFHTGWIGGLCGLPALINNALLRYSTSSDWLQRSDKFMPIGRFDELLLPKSALVLLLVGLVWVWLRRRELTYLWSLAFSGLFLLNQQVLTGLQIENFHWIYVYGPCLSLLLALLVAGEFLRADLPRPALAALWLLGAVHLADGFWLRAQEALRTRQTREILADFACYRQQRLGGPTERLAPNAVLAGAPEFLELGAILEDQRPLDHYCLLLSPSIDDAEWDRRVALNDYLRGFDRADFARCQEATLSKGWGPWVRDVALRAKRLAARLSAFDAIRAHPAAALEEFAVRYVALPANQPPPEYLREGWRRLQGGPSWQVWERLRAG
ncbi:MAG: hypothetical protein IRY99_02635 [Isosphaeraceae bacterium]|nr:hypothetical protein [Isosphaeraceae bacterium]